METLGNSVSTSVEVNILLLSKSSACLGSFSQVQPPWRWLDFWLSEPRVQKPRAQPQPPSPWRASTQQSLASLWGHLLFSLAGNLIPGFAVLIGEFSITMTPEKAGPFQTYVPCLVNDE